MKQRFFSCSAYLKHNCKTKVTEWKSKLKNGKVPEAEHSVELIVSHVLGRKIYSHLSYEEKHASLGREKLGEIDRLCSMRLSHLPLQYVLGEWDFRNLTLKMSPPVFIPRPETEMLVDLVKKEKIKEDTKILEVGCGTGAISLAIIDELKDIKHVVAIDANVEAVQITNINAQVNGISPGQLTVLHTKIEEMLKNDGDWGKFDAIVSNPPYIPTPQISTLEDQVKNFESNLALDGGGDGLDVIRQIIKFADVKLRVGGWIWLEVDDSHPDFIHETLPLNFRVDQMTEDLFGVLRFVKIVKVK